MSRRVHAILNTIFPHRFKDLARDAVTPFIPSLRHFNMPMRLAQAAALGLRPAVIHDVGAAGGNWARLARRIWPDAIIHGFEPNQREHALLARVADEIGLYTLHQCFLGNREGSVEYFDNDRQTSLLDDTKAGSRRTSPIHRLDDLVSSGTVPPPDFIKLDVQGFELEVLAGGERAMRHARALLLEVSFVAFHPGMPTIDAVLEFMKPRGFVWHDALGILRRPGDDCLWQMDALFLKADDPLRHAASQGWDDRPPHQPGGHA
jgi:FkbM family methyltransferase